MNYRDDPEDAERSVVEEIGAGHGPVAQAQAQVARQRSESTTPAGLAENAVRLHREMLDDARAEARELRKEAREQARAIVSQAQELADKILADAREQRDFQRSEQRAIATSTGELVATQLSHLQTLSEVNEKLRQPVERAPTAAEVAGDVVKTIATLGQSLLMQNPRLLQGAAERWASGTQRTAEDEPSAAAPAAQDAGAEAEFSALKLSELESLIAELPQDFVTAFAKERGLTSFDEVTIGDVRALFREVRTRRAAQAGTATSGRGDAQPA
jgi:hypothetical protein